MASLLHPLVWFLLTLSLLPAGAQTLSPGQGLQVSLSTSGYLFSASSAATVPAVKRAGGRLLPVPRQQESFTATATLSNFSNASLPLTYATPDAAAKRFQFRILNSEGAEIWNSSADGTVSAQVIVNDTLKSRSRVSRTATIPLKIDGAWLPTGRYRLVANFLGGLAVSSGSIFEMVSPVSTQETGLRGQVREFIAPEPGVNYLMAPSRGLAARVTVREIRSLTARYAKPAFTWEGQTDAEGNYQVATPAGRFEVTVTALNDVLLTPAYPLIYDPAVDYPPFSELYLPRTQSATVEVPQGSFATRNFTLPQRDDPTGADTSYTGLKGQVRSIPPDVIVFNFPTTDLQAGANKGASSFPYTGTGVAGITVTVEELQTSTEGSAVVKEGGFTWSGTTDESGNYSVETPAGQFRIRAWSRSGVALALAERSLLFTTTATVRTGYVTNANLRLPFGLSPIYPITRPLPVGDEVIRVQ